MTYGTESSLVLEPPAEYTTLPPTAYADTLMLLADMNDADSEVTHVLQQSLTHNVLWTVTVTV